MRFILCFIYVLLSNPASAQPSFLHEYCQNDILGNYTTNSTLRFLSNIIPSSNANGINLGFYNISYNQISFDKVYETGLCRGDVEPEDCRSCLNRSAHLLSQVCRNKDGEAIGIGGFDECVLRFSTRSSYGLMETHPRFYLWNSLEVESKHENSFSRQLIILLDDLKTRASTGGSLHKYATGKISVVGFQTVYALVQCMPDLSPLDCKNCLDEAFGDIPRYYVPIGGRVVTPSCNFRYAVYLFYGHAYDAPPATQPPPPPLTEAGATKGIIAVF